MSQFRKNPVVIEAVRWDGTNVAAIREHFGAFTDWHFRSTEFLIIHTLEGDHVTNPGDWVIKGVKGEFYPCKPEIFDVTYKAASDPDELAATRQIAVELAEALDKIARTPTMPFPDRGAHSERAFSEAVWIAWSRIQQVARPALAKARAADLITEAKP